MDDLYKQVLSSLNSKKNKELKEMVEEITMIMPSIVEMGKVFEKESVDKGFNEQQSFEIAKEYIVSTLVPDRNGK